MPGSQPEAVSAPRHTDILQMRGSQALSAFRRERLRRDIQARAPQIAAVDAWYWHFAAVSGELAAPDKNVLGRILTYGPSVEGSLEPGSGTLLLVVPRLGTISPWSSKATDIARHCGLDRIVRIERGVVWQFRKLDGSPINAVEREAIVPFIHDRMTENVLPDFAQVEA
jgi:phosphoribosylformylglycinamidine synthase